MQKRAKFFLIFNLDTTIVYLVIFQCVEKSNFDVLLNTNTMSMSEISVVQKGTIFIVDISGYTRFVKETDNSIGLLIVSQLLEEIIYANKLAFSISEIEGDAVLFYRYGKPYSVDIILAQFEGMLKAFNTKIAEYMLCTDSVNYLSIKAVVHYGEIGQFSIGQFKKLYGQSLIEAHRLLKNIIHSDTYSLITEQYMNAYPEDEITAISGIQQCEKYDVGEICYTYYPYSNRNKYLHSFTE